MRYRLLFLALVTACHTQPALAPAPAADFAARSPNDTAPPPRDRCWIVGRFDGTALLRDHELELVMPRAWVQVTRDNDKEWDELKLQVDVSAHPLSAANWPYLTRSVPVILTPTVDSAGPQLTTWQQSDDTLRVLVPWKASVDPRWLLIRLSYRTLSHGGRMATCEGSVGTDTLRFARRNE